MTDQPIQAWICPVCGYIHYGAEPPEECPICGTPRDQFEPYTERQPAAPTPTGAMAQTLGAAPALRILVAGAGIAGVSAAEAARLTAPGAEIVLLSAENEPPYYRLNLTRYLAGEVGPGELPIHPPEWYTENRIQLIHGAELKEIHLGVKQVTLADGRCLEYDRLVLTTGARPFVPPFAGADRRNVTTLRTRADADFLLEEIRKKGECVCIGGGLLGLETAAGLARRGAQVSVVENQPWLLPRQLNPAGSRILQEYLGGLGIRVHTGAKTQELAGDQAVRGVQLEGGACLPAGLVVVSAGIRSNIAVPRQAGLAANLGVTVDARLATDHPDVYAAGDLAEHAGVVYGTWAPAQLQGAAAGTNAAGGAAEFHPQPRSNSLKVLGIDLFSIGQILPQDGADRVIESATGMSYTCFVFHDNVLSGAILLGDAHLAGPVKKAVEAGLDCAALLHSNPTAQDVLETLAEK